MRYYQHGETGRLVKVEADILLNPNNWIELNKEQYENAKELHPPTGGSNVQNPSEYKSQEERVKE